ncbi:autotransporter domain-containing protein [Cyanobium sp. HWJ4-Hawea]|nr:autotransporter domain-containing protein [Cyanobium sp. HWJ4-Hawea]
MAIGSLITGINESSLANPIPASIPVVVDGISYNIQLVQGFPSDPALLSRIRVSPWIGTHDDSTEARKFSAALNPPGTSYLFGTTYGCSNSLYTETRYGIWCPFFVNNYSPYNDTINITSSPVSIDSGDSPVQAPYTPFINYLLNAYGYYAVAASPIIARGNVAGGSGLNLSSNLLITPEILTPVFAGGTLTVDKSYTSITQNFALNDSATNKIDSNGNASIFSGVFSDLNVGTPGNITFSDSSGTGATTTLTASNIYSGFTDIASGRLLAGANEVIPNQSAVSIQPGATLDLTGRNETVGSIEGGGSIELNSGTGVGSLIVGQNYRTTTFTGVIGGVNGTLTKIGSGKLTLSGQSTYTGNTEINAGVLEINGTIQSNTTVKTQGVLGGIGTISGSVQNLGIVSPGKSGVSGGEIGTLIVDGNYEQTPSGTLLIEVNGTSSDQLKLTGANRTILVEGNLDIESLQGTSITPGIAYTAIDVPAGTRGGELGLNTKLGVVGSSGYDFLRETDPRFSSLKGAIKCTGINDPNCTKLQFGWVQKQAVVDPTPTPTPTPAQPDIPVSLPPGQATINTVKATGGGITQAAAGNPVTNEKRCVLNSGDANACKNINTPGTGVNGSTNNNVGIAKAIDAGASSLQGAVQQGVTGGVPIPTTQGTNSGYTSSQTDAALLPADFVNVLGALYSLPTRSSLNQALHQISAEPYASMQSVALQAMEQFRKNTLALSSNSNSSRFIIETDACTLPDGSFIKINSQNRPADCKPKKIKQATRWSLLIDADNSQASLDSNNDLASLDYNIFQSTYGLQFDASEKLSVGAAFGYGQANLYNYEYASTSINSNTFSGGLWGVYQPSETWKLKALIGYTNLQYQSNRNIAFGDINRAATANWSGNGFTSAIQAEYDWILNKSQDTKNSIRIKPTAQIAYSLHNQGTFQESGADSLNLTIKGHTADSLLAGLGATLETPIKLNKSNRIIPRLSIAYQYDFMGNSNTERGLSSSFTQIPALGSIDVTGQNSGINNVSLELNIEYETSEAFSLYAGVGGSIWSNGQQVNYGGGLRWKF